MTDPRQRGRHTMYVLRATRGCWVVIALLTLSRAVAYFPLSNGGTLEATPQALMLLGEAVPLYVSGWAWVLAFLVSLWGLWRPTVQKLVPMLVPYCLWGAAFLVSWGRYGGSALATSVIYFSFALFMVTGSALAAYALRLADKVDGAEAKRHNPKE